MPDNPVAGKTYYQVTRSKQIPGFSDRAPFCLIEIRLRHVNNRQVIGEMRTISPKKTAWARFQSGFQNFRGSRSIRDALESATREERDSIDGHLKAIKEHHRNIDAIDSLAIQLKDFFDVAS